MEHLLDKIDINDVQNLYHLFCTRVHRSPNKVAYQYYDEDEHAWRQYTWSQMADHVARWQAALKNEDLSTGDRVAVMINNCPEWLIFEQAALGLGLVVVPLYTNDRADNICYVINDANIKLLFIQGDEQWLQLKDEYENLGSVQTILSKDILSIHDSKVTHIKTWLPDEARRFPLAELNVYKTSLATIVYTSGTTGKPKGVMLSHYNILWNADSGTDTIPVYADDIFLSFLPLSHMFERTVGHYLPIICGSVVSYARSIEKLAEDLIQVKPTILITVPRIFERVYNKISAQLEHKSPIARFLFNSTVSVGWRRFLRQQKKSGWHPSFLFWPILNLLVARKIMAKLGGKMRLSVSGGAPLNAEIARIFISLGLPISQGYGMTELSPIVSANRLDDNVPASIGQTLRDVEVKLGDADELCVRSPGIMLGYWNNEEATRKIIDADGWLHTGDKARIENSHIYITGRIKEILVLSNGEKVPPADIEHAITQDPLFEQSMVIGEQKPFLAAIVVFNEEEWKKLCAKLNIEATLDNLNSDRIKKFTIDRIQKQLHDFPGYANIYRLTITLEPWTIENNMLTATLKLRRHEILQNFDSEIKAMYKGH
jgi:long-chain acyl-CoA synthetase